MAQGPFPSMVVLEHKSEKDEGGKPVRLKVHPVDARAYLAQKDSQWVVKEAPPRTNLGPHTPQKSAPAPDKVPVPQGASVGGIENEDDEDDKDEKKDDNTGASKNATDKNGSTETKAAAGRNGSQAATKASDKK